MILEVVLKSVFKKDKEENGSPIILAGKPITKIAIKTDSDTKGFCGSDEWISCTSWNEKDMERNLQVGDTVTLYFYTQQSKKDGKLYKNFKVPSKMDILEHRVSTLESIVLNSKNN